MSLKHHLPSQLFSKPARAAGYPGFQTKGIITADMWYGLKTMETSKTFQNKWCANNTGIRVSVYRYPVILRFDITPLRALSDQLVCKHPELFCAMLSLSPPCYHPPWYVRGSVKIYQVSRVAASLPLLSPPSAACVGASRAPNINLTHCTTTTPLHITPPPRNHPQR